MSRDREPRRDEDPPEDPGRPGPEGRLSTTRPGTLVAGGLVGLVVGWLVHQVNTWLGQPAPTVSWLPVVALLFVAAVVGAVAWSTYRLLHRRHERLEPHHAVNRLVLAKACAVAGALFGGAYFGYALSWVGLTGPLLARQRILHSVLAGAAAVLLVVGALLLERACRVGKDDR